MKKSAELKQKRAAKIKKWDALVETANTENRELTDEELNTIDQYRTEVNTLNRNIDAQVELEERQANASAVAGKAVGNGEQKEKEKVQSRFSITKMFRSALNGEQLDGAEKEAQEIAEQENRNAGVNVASSTGKIRLMVPLSFIRASQQTVSQDSGSYGGELVNNQAPRLVAGLEPKLMIEQLGATVLSGLSGGDIKLPVANSAAFEWLAEGSNITQQKKEFTGPTLSPKRAGASISLTNRLISQSSIAVDDKVRELLARGWENAINAAAINGPGTLAPTGILNYTGVLSADDTAAATSTFAKVVELQGLIEENDATEVNLAYLLHPKLKAVLKTTAKDSGSGKFVIEGRELDGYNYVSTSLVPVGDDSGTAVYPLIFGDFSQLFVGQWGAVSFLVNPYSEDLADSIRITVNTHADVAIANPKAFAVNGFLR